MIGLPAADLLRVVARVLPDTSPFRGEARFVADEILRLRDAGQLSKNLAGDIGSLIYQRQMHSWHSGDFQLTTPIKQLENKIDRYKREGFPDSQVDPVLVRARIVDIATGIPLPMPEPEDFLG